MDWGGASVEILQTLRPDLNLIATDETAFTSLPADSCDAVTILNITPSSTQFAAIYKCLRPGGRMIILQQFGEVDQATLTTLEKHHFTRILIEPTLENQGVLIRGEKRHEETDTLKRIESVAQKDISLIDWQNYQGRFVYLLIAQVPNIPVWRRKPEDVIEWQALAIQDQAQYIILAFSSFPRAVSFMQEKIQAGSPLIINKVAKFAVSTARNWPYSVLLNPEVFSFPDASMSWLGVDPATAEESDE
ncbi:hypothetical protein MASR2M15_24100 [Anaerolineales bacterium]